jgi:serine/threonine protein kinase
MLHNPNEVSPRAPVQIGDFLIERPLGAGGMGIVYLARQLSLDRLVALKILGNSLTDPIDKARFQREAQAAAKLRHPNIATVFFIGQDHQHCYMAIEYINGVTLREVIRRTARTTKVGSSMNDFTQEASSGLSSTLERFDLPATTVDFDQSVKNAYADTLTLQAKELITTKEHVSRCCDITREAALALSYAHQQGVIHRDVKPENLMLDQDGHVHIIDFGVARFLEDTTLTYTGQLIGTPLYMSPEQITGRLELDSRTDIYSLGMVLYELLTLLPPVTAPTREGVLRSIMVKPLPPVSWKNAAVSSELEGVIHKALAKVLTTGSSQLGRLRRISRDT